MGRFGRSGHWRTNANGTTFYVRSHTVYRDHWDIGALRQSHRGQSVYYASDFLRRNNVGLGKQSCFVNPNAKCPVCGVPVFFYANQYGSRVYFDDLGPPWPKHPCTDNPTQKINDQQEWKAIIRRPKGLILELIDNANTVGLFHGKELGQRKIGEWTLLLIEEVERLHNENILKVIFLDTGIGEKKRIRCFSEKIIFHEGEMIAWNGLLFSYFMKEKMSEIKFTDGDHISVEEESVYKEIKEKELEKKFDIEKYSLKNWNETERRHFQFKRNGSVKEFVSKYELIIKKYVAQGIATPEQFSLALGSARYRTAVGAQWSPLLSEFLVYFVFNGVDTISVDQERDLLEDEMHNFHTKKKPIDKFIEIMKPKLQQAKWSSHRTDAAIANYFNNRGIRTASGQMWSGHLVRYLKKIVANSQSVKSKISLRAKTKKLQEVDVHQPIKADRVDVYSRQEIADKLSKIGLVKDRKG